MLAGPAGWFPAACVTSGRRQQKRCASGRRRRPRGSPARSRASCSTGCSTARSIASRRAPMSSRWSTAPA
jgi:hypothetical protein